MNPRYKQKKHVRTEVTRKLLAIVCTLAQQNSSANSYTILQALHNGHGSTGTASHVKKCNPHRSKVMYNGINIS